MMVHNPANMASASLGGEIQQLSELHTQLADLDISRLQASHDHRQKLDIVAAKKESYYNGINQIRQVIQSICVAGQKLLSPVQVSQGDIEVTLGTEDDQKNIDNAWEDFVNEQVDGLTAYNDDTGSAVLKQRKHWLLTQYMVVQRILKSINTILGSDLDDESHAMINYNESSFGDTWVANLASDRITFLELELAKTKEELRKVQGENESPVLEIGSTRDQLQNVKKDYDALLSVQSDLVKASTRVKDLEYELYSKEHPNYDINALAIATSLRFFNLSTRRNDFGIFTAIRGRRTTDVDAINLGSAAVYSGNIRVHVFLIMRNPNGKFNKYRGLFETLYGVTLEEVAQGLYSKYRFNSKHTEIANLRGTMAYCLSFTKLSHDSGKDISFEYYRGLSGQVFLELCERLGSAAEAQKAFDTDPDVEDMCVQMRRIAKHTTWMERQRIQGQRVTS
ncbi:hypothetical protein SBOR_1947 [Sclerotinia borealis F-4128]|uniref:Uncharacterized protein n=1 Tax=Sclerotinia borealis (strain F-4128) TaxID=1432307 RepID=W9CT39_SCLBF|nr:hypothetical protein SBOR_1947 [Sclerotinia borealis F-4128]